MEQHVNVPVPLSVSTRPVCHFLRLILPFSSGLDVMSRGMITASMLVDKVLFHHVMLLSRLDWTAVNHALTRWVRKLIRTRQAVLSF